MEMREEVAVGDLLVDRVTLRAMVREQITKAVGNGLHALGRWEKPAIQWQMRIGGSVRNILTIAAYKGPYGDVLFVYYGDRMWSKVIR
jgi:hypothetical protein